MKCLITPQKKAPELKELSPLPSRLSLLRTSKLEILHSPATPHKDLFNQLLLIEHTPQQAEQHPYSSYYYDLGFDIMQEEESDEHMDRSEFNEQDLNSEELSMQENDDDDNGMRKRKRKSTAQIKILKAELDLEPNWSKDKIAEMSERTGLSQSQVYKWWWDQKKKNVREEKTHLEKRKLIRKESCRRGAPYDKSSHGYYIDESLLTKPKSAIEIEQAPATQKKINVRLVFL